MRQIEGAHAYCRVEQVRELARILVQLPVREYQLIGQYYLVWCKCREWEFQSEVLERVAEHSHTYRAKALISRAAFDVYKGNAEGALYFYAEALRVKPILSDVIKASTGIATLKSLEGFNGSALKDLERLVPVLHYAEPLTLFQALNSYAVELTEVGRLYEAENVLAKATTSPLAPFYPELQETISDVRSKRKQRSTVTILRSQIEQSLDVELPEDPLHRARIQVVIDFINVNVHRGISLPELAGIINVSSGYLSHLFKAHTGIAPGAYMIRIRMEKAAHLLATTFLSIKEVMASVGYGNRHNFLKHFKRHFDVIPSAYRKRAFARQLPLKF